MTNPILLLQTDISDLPVRDRLAITLARAFLAYDPEGINNQVAMERADALIQVLSDQKIEFSHAYTNFMPLMALIQKLHDTGAMHRKRGCKVTDLTPLHVSSHLIEETVELQGVIIDRGQKDLVIDEGGDALLILLHIFHLCGVDLCDVAASMVQKLTDDWTTDPDEVLTDTPGFGRHNRKD